MQPNGKDIDDDGFLIPHLDPEELNDGERHDSVDVDVPPKRTLTQIMTELGHVKHKIGRSAETLKAFKEVEADLKTELMYELEELGLKSAKSDEFTASITSRPTVVIKNEMAIIEWLNTTPDVEADFYIGLKQAEFKVLASSVLNDSEASIPGVEVEVRESLAIRANKKKEAKSE